MAEAVDADLELLDELRQAAPQQDADGQPLWPAVDPKPRASHMEVETRIAEAQLWIAQRLPLAVIREKAAQNWGISNIKTISKYLALARQRMVQELLTDRRRHQAEQIFALNECARRAMEAEQFNAAVGAFRVIAEIGGLLRAPIKPPEPRA